MRMPIISQSIGTCPSYKSSLRPRSVETILRKVELPPLIRGLHGVATVILYAVGQIVDAFVQRPHASAVPIARLANLWASALSLLEKGQTAKQMLHPVPHSCQ